MLKILRLSFWKVAWHMSVIVSIALCDKNLLIDKPCDKLVLVLLIALCKHWDKVVALLSFLQGQLAGQLAVDYDIVMGTKLTKVLMMIGSKHKIFCRL